MLKILWWSNGGVTKCVGIFDDEKKLKDAQAKIAKDHIDSQLSITTAPLNQLSLEGTGLTMPIPSTAG